MRTWALGCALLLAEASGGHAQKAADGRLIKRIYFKPVACGIKKCENPKEHGNVFIVLENGRTIPVVSNGSAVGNSPRQENPQISPDQRAAGWLIGEHVNQGSYTYFGGSKLALFRDGHVRRKIPGSVYFIEQWSFWKGGKQVRLKTRAAHGPAQVELYDTASGTRMESLKENDLTASSPQWTQALRDGN